MKKAIMLYSKGYEQLDYGPDHPFRPERFTKTKNYFMTKFPDLKILEPKAIRPEELLQVHSKFYIEHVKNLSNKGYGYLSVDTPVFPGIFEWALLYCGAAKMGIDLLLSGYDVVFNPCGGLHHAKRDSDGGFCVFNDVAFAAVYAEKQGRKPVIIDIDAHAGDGTMEILYEKPILKISIHEDPHYLYPGNGFIDQFGEKEGYGFNINIPLPPLAGDNDLNLAFSEIVIPAVKKFKPDIIILQSGVDGYYRDPLTSLSYTGWGYRRVAKLLASFNLPILMLGGGGYDLNVVPILWAIIFGELIGNSEGILEDLSKMDEKAKLSNEQIVKRTKKVINQILKSHPFFL
ncbi:MAG: hypothetical protein J7K59_05790, partial [Candidatus Korarchaeota archaeon]|nr:hypothetical protein [Candidatus Korarchaeota archaeon]